VDPWDDDCSDYTSNPGWCGPGKYEDDDFTNTIMCCTCGGGTTGGSGGASTPAPPALGCSDTDNGAVDPYYDDCSDYTSYPSWCVPDQYDDLDFSNQLMCCACGGGQSSVPTQAALAQANAQKVKKAGKPRPKPTTTVGLAQVGGRGRAAKTVKRDRYGKPRVKKE
jgi:hypothetical protein